ncbi:MAG: peptidoglycan-binding domain-containing protein [Candidatus Omnitrophota bacterium]|nr:peptidoglycan-binding domain-containing protein [Candidatus Omnitrophota bacterium]
MLMRMMGVILFTLIIGGCATGVKKQTTQQSGYQGSPQTYQQNTSSWDYEDVQPAKSTTYSAPVNLNAKQIQKALKGAGFYQGPIDGKFGLKTKEAIIKFQNAYGLKAVGIVGRRTSVELNKYLSQ